jgi:hypothetical protein
VDQGGSAEMGVRLCASLWWYLFVHGRLEEAHEWSKALLDLTPSRTSLARFYCTCYMGIAAGELARFAESEAALMEARNLAEALDDQSAVALADGASGLTFLLQGRFTLAEEYFQRGLDLARIAGPRYYLPIFLHNAGWTALQLGQVEGGAQLLDESIDLAEQIGDHRELSISLPLRAAVSLRRHELAEARRFLRRARALEEGLPTHDVGLVSLGLGHLALLEGDVGEAERQFLTILDEAARSGFRSVVCGSLDGLAFTAAARGDVAGAVRMLATVASIRDSIHQARPRENQLAVEALLAKARTTLDQARFDTEWQEGERLTLDEGIEYARHLVAARGLV